MDEQNYGGMRFCPHCQNILTPDYGIGGNKLKFLCRTCNVIEVNLERTKEECLI